MSLHPKAFLTYLPVCLAPLLLLAGLNYWNGLRAVDSALNAQAQTTLNSLVAEVDRRLEEEKLELTRAAFSTDLRTLIDAKAKTAENQSSVGPPFSNSVLNLSSVLKGRGHFTRIAAFDHNLRPVFQLERVAGNPQPDSFSLRWNESTIATPASLGAKQTTVTLNGSTLRFFVPVAPDGQTESIGTLIGELNLDELIGDASRLPVHTEGNEKTFIAAIDSSARILFHQNRELQGKVVSSALPEFLPIAEALARKNSGISSFESAGKTFVTAFSPLPQWNIGIAVGYGPYLSAGAHTWGIVGIVLAFIGGVAGAVFLSYHIQKKSQGIERVEEGLTAIAKGEFDRRIELKSSDDARAIADNINAMAEQMRAQIAREEESRQFQNFARLSAMLTHDLKNSIEALSLIVGNMEQHFDNPEFRADALKSLTSATEKLKVLVTRLSKPLTSLSGDHPRPKSIDLIPILKRVAAKTAEPMRSKHSIEMKLPKNLFAYVDAQRVENVIENLIINALEAMSDRSGKLTIEAGVTSRGAAMFAVSDTGDGMSQEFINDRLYRPFSTTKRNGVGLGLYTCREIVEASSGLIEVESKVGAGTTFRVVLPSASHDSRN